MANLGRESAFLPTIKCSMCHQDIQIAQMGEHICEKPHDPTPPPDADGRNYNLLPPKQNASNGEALNPGRPIPPRVDIYAANRPFLSHDQLTPLSLSPSRSASPLTPSLRITTSPLLNPPSPESHSPNVGNTSPSFPPKPVTKTRTQLAGGYGGFSAQPAEYDSMYAPVSPMTATSNGLLQRASAISPGPFGINEGNKEATIDRGHLRQRSLKFATMSSRTAATPENMPRPSTSSGALEASTPDTCGSIPGIPRVPRNNGYGGFGPPLLGGDAVPAPLRLESRSQTFPLGSGEEPIQRKPLEQVSGLRRPSEPNPRRPSVNNRATALPIDMPPRKPSLVGPILSRTPPPRHSSFSRPGTAPRSDNIPPVPSDLNLAAEFGTSNPYHASSESQSSDASDASHVSRASSHSSPPRSAAPGRAPWNNVSPTETDKQMSKIQTSMTDLQVRDEASSSPPRDKAQAAQPQAGNISPSPLSMGPLLIPTIPEDPVQPPPRNPTPISPGEQPNGRRMTKKGNCKGCKGPITGKSVSSADGRLTGRYHKTCFVCTTCSEPFQTATFYVIDDAPYCEHHYHRLNGSVCTSCNRGIEGQYLESERRQKFHPGCLTCSDCRRNLRHDYFEMGGRVYCERDAFRRAQQGRFLGPGGPSANNRMQRRTTRLMMM